MGDDSKPKQPGEGDYEAARRYRENAERHAAESDVESEAEAARDAVETDEAGDLSAAEAKGRSRARKADPASGKP